MSTVITTSPLTDRVAIVTVPQADGEATAFRVGRPRREGCRRGPAGQTSSKAWRRASPPPQGGAALALPLDVTDGGVEVNAAAQQVADRLGSVDLVLRCEH